MIIPSYNTRDLLSACIRSVSEGLTGDSGVSKSIKSEIIVVDNGSTDGSANLVERDFPNAIVIRNETNEGFARAANRGATLARGQFILVANSDVVFLPGSIATMVEYAVKHPGAGIMGPQLVYPDGSWQRSYGEVPSVSAAIRNLLLIPSFRHGIRRLLWPRVKIDRRPMPVGYVDGAAMLVRREAWDELEGFDESFFFYAEDADICQRAWKLGFRVVFLPQAHVVHIRGGGSSTVGTRELVRLKLESDVKLVEKHWGSSSAVQYVWLTRGYALERLLLERLFLACRGCCGAERRSSQGLGVFEALYQESSSMLGC